MAQAKAKAKAAATSDDIDPKIEKAAAELRKAGATSAILSHTLGIPYSRAVALTKAYDDKVGHAPQKIVRTADGIKLEGWVVKDGRQAAATAR